MPDSTNAIWQVIQYIKNSPRGYVFQQEIDLISKTEYRVKSWYDLFQDATTTWGPRLVLLHKGFFGLKISDQAIVLVHETVHQRQYEKMGTMRFLWSYVTEHVNKGYNLNKYEIEAHERAIAFARSL